MTTGKQNRLILGTYNAICDICGFKCKADDMLLRWDGFRVDRKCWEPRQPQDFLRSVREYSNPPPWTRPDTEGGSIGPDYITLYIANDYFVEQQPAPPGTYFVEIQ